jgi:hypothetical protein
VVRWTGFADLGFSSSARLAFARALERAETDVHEQTASAWVVDDRRVGFSFDAESSVAVLEGCKRLLDALAIEAHAGEAFIECKEPHEERWARRAALPSISKEITIVEEYDGPSETIRTEAS